MKSHPKNLKFDKKFAFKTNGQNLLVDYLNIALDMRENG